MSPTEGGQWPGLWEPDLGTWQPQPHGPLSLPHPCEMMLSRGSSGLTCSLRFCLGLRGPPAM